MKHFINLEDISALDLRRILQDAKKRKIKRKNFHTLDVDKDIPLKGKLLIQMFEKASLITRLSFYLAIKQLGGGTITLKANELHLGRGDVEDYKYSKALASYGKEWTFEELNGFLIKPATYLKGTKMSYAGLRKEGDRASIIKYLNQNSDNPKPLP